MLKRFECANVKGFKDRLIFDFSAGRYPFNQQLIQNGLVSKALVYGRNGTGKSNLGLALLDIVAHLTDKRLPPSFGFNNFLCLDSQAKVAWFKYVFLLDGDEIEYEYAKSRFDWLSEEKLTVNGERVVDCRYPLTGKPLAAQSLLGSSRIDGLDCRLSLLKFIYRNTPRNPDSPIVKLVEFVQKMVYAKGEEIVGLDDGAISLEEWLFQAGRLSAFQSFLQDNGINKRLVFLDLGGSPSLGVEYPDGEIVPFRSLASSGEWAGLTFFCLLDRAKDIRFLFLDDFDGSADFQSAGGFLRRLNGESGVQAVLVAHNTHWMSNRYYRPDCLFFLRDGAIESLNRRTDKEIREAHNLEKMYLNGAFGV